MTEEKTSMVDALIQNPFGEDVVKNTSLQDVSADFPQEQVEPQKALVDSLPEKQQEQARALAKQIDEKNMQAIISYGAGAQKQLGEFSHSMLAHVQNKDTGEIGDTLNEWMMRLNETNPQDLVAEDSNIFRKIFGRVKKSIYEMQSKYQEVGSQVDKIAVKLDHEKNGLLNDNLSLEQLYQRNKEFFEAFLEERIDEFELEDYGYKPFTIDEFIITFMGNLYLYDGLMDYFIWGYDILKKKK